MTDTVFLLGAGASCQCVPTVQNFTNQLRLDFDLEAGLGTVLKSNFADEFDRFYPALRKHRSLDTFARLLYLQGKTKEYQLFKTFLDGYVSARSFFHDDLRYSAFLADVGLKSKNNQIEFSPKVSLFTWNYDFLFEKELLFANENPDWSSIFSRVTHFNGVASGLAQVDNAGTKLLKNLKEVYEDRFLDLQGYTLLVNSIVKHVKESRSGIHFAWENSDEQLDSLRSEITKKIKQATNVVIVGYTFPFYNRLIDETFLDALGEKNKVVLQDVDLNQSTVLIGQLELLNDHRGLKNIKGRIKPYANSNGFYIPFDLDLKKL